MFILTESISGKIFKFCIGSEVLRLMLAVFDFFFFCIFYGYVTNKHVSCSYFYIIFYIISKPVLLRNIEYPG